MPSHTCSQLKEAITSFFFPFGSLNAICIATNSQIGLKINLRESVGSKKMRLTTAQQLYHGWGRCIAGVVVPHRKLHELAPVR